MATVTLINNKEEYDSILKDNPKVVIDFYADWCGPCKLISPKFVEMAAEFTGIKFCKVNVDDAEDVAAACGISAMPTFLYYHNGTQTASLSGANETLLKKNLNDLQAL